MTPEQRARMEYLCKRITVEKDSLELEKLSLELNDLVSATLKSVQQKPKQTATPSQGASNRVDFAPSKSGDWTH
jgi:hypothetical protein